MERSDRSKEDMGGSVLMGSDGSKADMGWLPRLQGREPEDRERVLAREDRKGDRQILQAGSCTLSPLKYILELFWIILACQALSPLKGNIVHDNLCNCQCI